MRRCSSAGNLVKAGCSHGMQIRLCFLFCLDRAPWQAALLAGPAEELRARCPGHHDSSWLTPGEAKLAKDDPPAAWSQRTRSCIASSPMTSAVGLPNHFCPSWGQISPFTECFKLEEGTDGSTARSTEAIPPGPSFPTCFWGMKG